VPRNEILVDADAELVFDVLTDAETYRDWVVGSRDVRDVEGPWPRPGGRFHHTVGWLGPLGVEDDTEVEEIDPPRSIVLRVKTRPWMVGRVELYVKPEDGGRTRVIMYESTIGGLATKTASTVLGLPLWGRNIESLRRLKRIAESRAAR
jgi:uncharacterized protein YndB with AHSA1/START domain